MSAIVTNKDSISQIPNFSRKKFKNSQKTVSLGFFRNKNT